MVRPAYFCRTGREFRKQPRNALHSSARGLGQAQSPVPVLPLRPLPCSRPTLTAESRWEAQHRSTWVVLCRLQCTPDTLWNWY